MKNPHLIFIPVFIGMILLEMIYSFRYGKNLYSGKDTFANVALGLFAGVAGIGMKAIAFLVYSALYSFGWGNMEVSVLSFALCFIANDVVFYVFHRMGHEVMFFWAAHETHHSSKKYNLTTSFRLPLSIGYRFLFWVPLAFFFDPAMIIFIDSISTTYQFFLHTEVVGKLGPLEWILNTPSHHRVHHASNPQYLDKNYGGVFIIWDRLLGTFAEEKEKPVYGITKPVGTHNPVRIAIHGWVDAFKRALRQRTWLGAFWLLLRRPS